MSSRTGAASFAVLLAALPAHAAGQIGRSVGIDTGVQQRTVAEMRLAGREPFQEPPDPVVDEAVGLIRKAFPSIPRIYVVDPAALKLKTSSPKTPAFRVWFGDRVNQNIFVNKFGDLYRYASDGDPCALKSLAGVLAHEVAHTLTKDEREPSRVELSVLGEFLEDPSIRLSERTCLIQRRKAVQEHGGIK